MREKNFRIEGFTPSLENKLGGYGFSVYLNSEFARKVKSYKAEDRLQKRFNEIGKEIMSRIFEQKLILPPYTFLDDTLLVRFLSVPGDACELGISGIDIEWLDKYIEKREDIEYFSHNVDALRQAYSLLSLFNEWVLNSEALISRH